MTINQHWFRSWLAVEQATSHYLNQCWNIVNWILENKLQWDFNRNSNIFIQENAVQNVVCKMASILSRPQCVKCISLKSNLNLLVKLLSLSIYIEKVWCVCCHLMGSLVFKYYCYLWGLDNCGSHKRRWAIISNKICYLLTLQLKLYFTIFLTFLVPYSLAATVMELPFLKKLFCS